MRSNIPWFGYAMKIGVTNSLPVGQHLECIDLMKFLFRLYCLNMPPTLHPCCVL